MSSVYHKKKILILCLFLSIILYLVIEHSVKKTRISFERSIQPEQTELLLEPICDPAINIAYLKTHKCASTAIQNILFRYGLSHDLTFAIPAVGNYFGIKVPFHSSMVPKYLLNNFELNIFASHTVWNYPEVESVMPNNTIYLTSVRDPSTLFESLYSYTDMEPEFGLTLEEYIKKYDVKDVKRLRGHLGYNQMCFDFGFNPNRTTDFTYIREQILEADKNFDLVLITERLEESLILLRHLLCWPLEYVVVPKLNARINKFKTSLNEETLNLLRKRQSADEFLYNFFNEKLDKLVSKFGQERMNKEIEELRLLRERKMKTCSFEESQSDKLKGKYKLFSEKVSGFMPKRSNSSECWIMASSENYLVDYVRKKQRLKLFSKSGYYPNDYGLPFGAFSLNNKLDLKKVVEAYKKHLRHSLR